MNAYLELKAYPDVELALQSLKEADIRLGFFLSNPTRPAAALLTL